MYVYFFVTESIFTKIEINGEVILPFSFVR